MFTSLRFEASIVNAPSLIVPNNIPNSNISFKLSFLKCLNKNLSNIDDIIDIRIKRMIINSCSEPISLAIFVCHRSLKKSSPTYLENKTAITLFVK